MGGVADIASLVLASVGLTVLIVWPESGPSAWIRDRVLRRLLPAKTGDVLDCYICCGFWAGLILAPIWWWFTRQYWCWAACLMTPALFWMILGNPQPLPPTDREDDHE